HTAMAAKTTVEEARRRNREAGSRCDAECAVGSSWLVPGSGEETIRLSACPCFQNERRESCSRAPHYTGWAGACRTPRRFVGNTAFAFKVLARGSKLPIMERHSSQTEEEIDSMDFTRALT